VFIAEFQLMLAMNIISTSIFPCAPECALRSTACIMPCTASGYFQE